MSAHGTELLYSEIPGRTAIFNGKLNNPNVKYAKTRRLCENHNVYNIKSDYGLIFFFCFLYFLYNIIILGTLYLGPPWQVGLEEDQNRLGSTIIYNGGMIHSLKSMCKALGIRMKAIPVTYNTLNKLTNALKNFIDYMEKNRYSCRLGAFYI